MSKNNKIVVSSLAWSQPPDELFQTQANAIRNLGYKSRFFYLNEPIPPDTKIVLVQGPYGTLLPLINQLVNCTAEHRPIMVYWFQQSLMLPRPEWVRRLFARSFSDLHRYHREAGAVGQLLEILSPDFANTKGRRLSFLGDILWLHRHSLLDVLVLSSTVYAKYLSQYGIDSIIVPRGYHPFYGRRLLNMKRDIAVVWMGQTRTKRRKKAIYWLQKQLEKQGQVMHIYDAEKDTFIYGEKRAQILNRAWFVLNIFTNPTDELSIRYYIAAANGAVILTEPGENEYEFITGEHLVECQVEDMPDVIQYYLAHEEEWRSISENMLSFMKNDLTLEQSISKMLNEAQQVLKHRL